MKPRTTWLLAALCFALLLGAMAWTTRSLLRMEATQNRMARTASVQEMARLGLWRMESIASTLVIAESARPPEHYRTMSTPVNLFSNRMNSVVGAGDFVACSPIVTERPPRVLLHFEMDQGGKVRSPQVPVGLETGVCLSNGWLDQPGLTENQQRLAKLQGLLQQKLSTQQVQGLRDSLQHPVTFADNTGLVWGWNASVPVVSYAADSVDVDKAPAPPKPSDEKADKTAAVLNSAQQAANWRPEQFAAQQSDLNTKEAATRAAITKNQMMQSRAYNDAVKEKMAPQKKSKGPAQGFTKEESKPQEKPLLPAPAPPAPPVPAPAAATYSIAPAPPVSSSLSFSTVPAASSVTVVSDFRALWLGEALLLTRRVSDGTRDWIQGAWIDWPRLKEDLWAAVREDFPAGKILPVTASQPAGAHLLASLPVRLVPGAIAFATPPFWTPLKASLSVAWVCVLIGVAAVALMLRGMMALSERRASFVSSVTHELRTPLATFKLYSEMLADGMVREESKRQQYLETLTTEADRLGHLVENVLAYSRIERGKGPVTMSTTTAGDLVQRIEPRLNQRALMGGMDFSVQHPADLAATTLRTDGSAVEQILFNLVDNACKYGRRDGAPAAIELHVSRDRRRLRLAVRDRGPGIDPREQRELFLPFHKSAREAAHSAPGVGLGLALCRRLAAELGGTLTIDAGWKEGAAFVLTLPC